MPEFVKSGHEFSIDVMVTDFDTVSLCVSCSCGAVCDFDRRGGTEIELSFVEELYELHIASV